MFKRIVEVRNTSLRFEGKSLTEQHHKRDCDINRLFNRLVGGDTTVLKTGGVYADITEMPSSLQMVLNHQIDGRRAYESLPDSVRSRFTTAESFYAAVMDNNSRKTFEELGLIKVPQDPPAVKVEVVNPSQVADPNAPIA